MLFKKKARILIDLAKSRVLDALGMPFWLSSGTCLGKIILGMQHIPCNSLIFIQMCCIIFCYSFDPSVSSPVTETDSPVWGQTSTENNITDVMF